MGINPNNTQLIDECIAALEKSENTVKELLKEKETLLKYIETISQLNMLYENKIKSLEGKNV